MPTRITQTNGVDVKKCEADIRAALKAWRASKFATKEALALDELYKHCSQFSMDCPICLAGRKEFSQGLELIKSGDVVGGLTRMRDSFASIRFKWSTFNAALTEK